MIRLSAMLVALVCAATPALAQKAGDLEITGAWTRATPKGAQVGGGYLVIKNTGSAPDRLIGGSSPTAGRFEIHEMTMSDGVMKMRPINAGLEIKPGQTVELKPGGYHVMFMNLKQPFEQGKPITATLEFAKAGKVNVEFKVEGVGATAPSGGGMHMPGGMKH